ncbi:MAG: alpha-glucosidase/alpha-galactosidase, partial [Candidatus Nealsonbacteria bacterium]|nr:alpha-glucosidase/alpha-galactosidase [Candidatus Nealsonbacteria bacterium]
EAPIFVDRRGFHPIRIGDLPVQLAALNQSNITVQTLAVEAGLSGDPELVMNAVAMDPLMSACCTLKEIREMTVEMMAAESRWIPQFKNKKLHTVPAVRISKNGKRVKVPLDPALAIANRFGELAARKVKNSFPKDSSE